MGGEFRDDARGFRRVHHRAGLAVTTAAAGKPSAGDRRSRYCRRGLARDRPKRLATPITGGRLRTDSRQRWVVLGFGGIAHWVIANAARLQGLYMHAADQLEQRGLYAAELFAEQVNVLWLVQVLRAIGGSLQGVLTFSVVTFVFVILGLLEVEPLQRRLRRLGNGTVAATAIDTVAEIAARLQTYMLVRLGMSVLTGLAFWIFAAVDGLELQREWGVIAFVLNFIPFIGSFVATLLPALFAAAQFESISAALVVFIGLNLLQFVIGSYIEPRVAGTAVSVSPFMVLFAVFFWGMLWDIAGAFIGVPILITLATVCARYRPSRPIAVLLSAGTTTQVKADQ